MGANGANYAGAAADVAGGVVGIMGARQQGEAAELQGQASMAAAQANAATARRNAALAAQAMRWETESAQLKKRGVAREAARVRGAGRAAYAAGNVKVDTGSPLSWEESVYDLAEEDMTAIDRQLAMRIAALKEEQSGYLTQAAYSMAQGRYAKKAAGINKQSATLGAYGSLLSTAGSLAQRFA